jgi:hypothetical protein
MDMKINYKKKKFLKYTGIMIFCILFILISANHIIWKTMIQYNYNLVNGKDNIYNENQNGIKMDQRWENSFIKESFGIPLNSMIYGTPYSCEMYFEFANEIKKIEFTKLLIILSDYNVDLLEKEYLNKSIIIRHPYPGENNEIEADKFKKEKSLYRNKDYECNIVFSNIEIDFKKINKFCMIFEYNIYYEDGKIRNVKHKMIFQKEILRNIITYFTT